LVKICRGKTLLPRIRNTQSKNRSWCSPEVFSKRIIFTGTNNNRFKGIDSDYFLECVKKKFDDQLNRELAVILFLCVTKKTGRSVVGADYYRGKRLCEEHQQRRKFFILSTIDLL